MIEHADIKLAIDMLTTMDADEDQARIANHAISVLEGCGNEINKLRIEIRKLDNLLKSK